MGHVINAKSMRIGWSTIWCDQWYSETLYYPEYLHALFKIRFYLIYIFTKRHFDKKAIFYSHFEILRNYKNIYIEVYYYAGKFETDYENYKFQFFLKLYNLEGNKDIETRKPNFLYTPLKLVIIWNWIIFFGHLKLKKRDIFHLSALFRKYKLKMVKKYINYLKKKGIFLINNKYINFLFLFSLYVQVKYYISQWSIWKSPKRNTVLRRFYMITGCYREIHSFIFIFGRILSYTFEKLTKFKKIKINFFLTNNNCVNAKFLSRFIARKLKQNYPVKQLLNPIKKELLYVMKLTACSRKSFYKKKEKKFIIYTKNIKIKKLIFKKLLLFLFNYFYKHLLNYFLQNKTWFTIDILIINLLLNNDLNTIIDIKSIMKNYFLKKSAYLCFFENNFSSKIIQNLFFPKYDNLALFTKRFKYLSVYWFINDYFYVSKFSLLNLYYYDKKSNINNNIIKLSCINLNRYIKYNYWIYNYHELNEFNINNLKSRIKTHTRGNNIKGYKMHLVGRFRRKQRAASYWFSKGKVPLNTINSLIDYAYYTIPLKNSAITVKVWLYKSDDTVNLHYIKL